MQAGAKVLEAVVESVESGTKRGCGPDVVPSLSLGLKRNPNPLPCK